MNANRSMDAPQTASDTAAAIRRRLAQVSFVMVAQAAVLFLSSGRLRWRAAWAYLAAYLGVIGATALLILPRYPELIAERGRVGKNAKGWDKLLAPAVSLLGPVATLLVAGLDARFGWSRPMARGIQAAAFGLSALGYAMTSWAMVSNRFFSGLVRIQEDRGHTVASGGPYRFVRHPGYVGMATFTLATPLLLGSRQALVPAALTVAALVLRTALEDRTLRRELDGYESYARQVHHRLLPGIW
jgi:protein-S-isoprenylcysteine O-methyltransferase Ste14